MRRDNTRRRTKRGPVLRRDAEDRASAELVLGPQVGVLLVKNVDDALRFEELGSATSELHWVLPEQVIHSGGRLQLSPGTATQLLVYARTHHLHPVGVVILDETGARTDILIEKAITPEYHALAKQLLRVHVSFWLAAECRASDGARHC